MKEFELPTVTEIPPDEEKTAAEEGKKTKFRRIHLVVGPIFFTLHAAEEIFRFSSFEWTQSQVKKEYFSGVSLHPNFSTCHIANTTSPEYITYKRVQQRSAEWLMYFNFAQFFPALVTALIFPAYSDSYGRRRIILIGMLGVGIRTFGVAAVILTEQKLYFIVISYVLQGLVGGGPWGFLPTLTSYVADITHGEKQRIQGIVLLDFVMVAAILVSSVMSGTMIETLGLGFANTCLICSAFFLLSFIMACLFLPETLDESNRLPKKSVWKTIKQALAFFGSSQFKGKRLHYIVLLMVYMFNELCVFNGNQLDILYLLGRPFCWGPAQIGYFALVKTICVSILGFIAMKLMQRCLSNVTIAGLGCLSQSGGLVTKALARTNLTIYAASLVGMLGFLVGPMTQGLLSNVTAANQQGSLFACLGLMRVVGNLLAVSENAVYAATLAIMDGAIFLFIAVFPMAALVCLLVYSRIQPRRPRSAAVDTVAIKEVRL